MERKNSLNRLQNKNKMTLYQKPLFNMFKQGGIKETPILPTIVVALIPLRLYYLLLDTLKSISLLMFLLYFFLTLRYTSIHLTHKQNDPNYSTIVGFSINFFKEGL